MGQILGEGLKDEEVLMAVELVQALVDAVVERDRGAADYSVLKRHFVMDEIQVVFVPLALQLAHHGADRVTGRCLLEPKGHLVPGVGVVVGEGAGDEWDSSGVGGDDSVDGGAMDWHLIDLLQGKVEVIDGGVDGIAHVCASAPVFSTAPPTRTRSLQSRAGGGDGNCYEDSKAEMEARMSARSSIMSLRNSAIMEGSLIWSSGWCDGQRWAGSGRLG
jgi:hypothetical protein